MTNYGYLTRRFPSAAPSVEKGDETTRNERRVVTTALMGLHGPNRRLRCRERRRVSDQVTLDRVKLVLGDYLLHPRAASGKSLWGLITLLRAYSWVEGALTTPMPSHRSSR